MKTLILIITMFLICQSLPAPGFKNLVINKIDPIMPYEKYWQATCQVESHGNPFAINDKDPNGGSYGIAQIGQQKLKDYNRANGTNLSLLNCLDTLTSKQVFMWHIKQYKSLKVAIKAWNGKGQKAEIYYSKIESLIR